MQSHIGRLETEARRMARSGAFVGFHAVQRRLLDTGFVEAQKLFKNRWTQAEIDRLCRASHFEPNAESRGCPIS
jgi:hypothetical protein